MSYGVHVYAAESDPGFQQATSLYHPDTVERSLKHDGSGTEPGLKDDDGKWDLRPHASRIQRVDLTTLGTWHAVLESDDVPLGQSRMVYTVNRSTAAVLDKLSKAPRIGSLGLQFSRGWDESIDRKKGMFDSEWGVPESWDSVILQGPHLHVANPFYKQPNPTMLHNQDWTSVDLEALPPDAIPATAYKPRGGRATYDAAYTHWDRQGDRYSAREQFRVAYRAMANNVSERTLTPTLIPPGAAHVNGVFAFATPSNDAVLLAVVAAGASSLIADFSVRATPKSGIYQGVFERLPLVGEGPWRAWLALRFLRLTAVTAAYSPLWEQAWQPAFAEDSWAGGIDRDNRPPLAVTQAAWTGDVPLRIAEDRRQAMLEIDVIVALALGISADELCTIYRTQFPVLAGYDKGQYTFDRHGRVVPTPVLSAIRKSGAETLVDQRTWTHPGSGRTYVFEAPFAPLERETDLQAAYATFQGRLDAS